MLSFFPSRVGGGRRVLCHPHPLLLWLRPVSVDPSPALPSYLEARSGRPALLVSPDLRAEKIQCRDAVQPPSTRGQGAAWERSAQCAGVAPPSRAPGLSPLTQRKHCPYLGSYCLVTRQRSPGRFRESPPPLCRAGPWRREGGRDFPRQAAAQARKAPGLGPERARWAGRASGPREPPQSLPHRAGAPALLCLTPSLSDLTRAGGSCCWRVVATAVPHTPARKGGARLPVSPPRCQAGSRATARSGPAGAAAWAAGRRHRPRVGLPLLQLGVGKADGEPQGGLACFVTGSPQNGREKHRQRNQATGEGWTEQTLY